MKARSSIVLAAVVITSIVMGSSHAAWLVTEGRGLPIEAKVRIEAGFILATQFNSPGHPVDGALNNVVTKDVSDPKQWDYVVPRENANAILGLLLASEITGASNYRDRAQQVADFLVRIQDNDGYHADGDNAHDGAWYNQYAYDGIVNQVKPAEDPNNPETKAKSPTQTAQVMIAFYRLGYDAARPERWVAMQRGAEFLMACQDPKNKKGFADGLLGGGKAPDGSFRSDRWTHDNSYAYQAFKAAEAWARLAGDASLARGYADAAQRIRSGINGPLRDPATGVWHKKINRDGQPDDNPHEWINYAPQMLEVPAIGVGSAQVGEWIHQVFQKPSGAVAQNDRRPGNGRCGEPTGDSDCLSPGLSFQAALVWLDLGQLDYARQTIAWAEQSGLWCLDCNPPGGWIDWQRESTGEKAPTWQRYIDTSFYAIAAWSGGYDFSITQPKTQFLPLIMLRSKNE